MQKIKQSEIARYIPHACVFCGAELGSDYAACCGEVGHTEPGVETKSGFILLRSEFIEVPDMLPTGTKEAK